MPSFPWICIKCGQAQDNEDQLVEHIEKLGHQLSTAELEEFRSAMAGVSARLAATSCKKIPHNLEVEMEFAFAGLEPALLYDLVKTGFYDSDPLVGYVIDRANGKWSETRVLGVLAYLALVRAEDWRRSFRKLMGEKE